MDVASATPKRLSGLGTFWPLLVRFIWKENRTLRPLVAGIAAIAAAVLALASWIVPSNAFEVIQVAAPWGAATLVALGAATSLFATEREEQTDVFLQLLPRHPRAVFTGKVLAAAGSGLLLAALLGILGALLAGGHAPSWPVVAAVSTSGALLMAEWFAWGLAASLLCTHPLLAPIIAIAAASLGAELARAASSVPASSDWLAPDAAPLRLLIVAAVALVDIHLGLRWLDPRTVRGTNRRLARAGAESAVAPEPRSDGDSMARPRFFLFRRLAWQTWREGRWAMLAALLVGLFLTASSSAVAAGIARATGSASLAPLGGLILPAICGALVFRADQRAKQFAFLHAHVAPPVAVWAARQLIWLAATVIYGIGLSTTILRESPLGWSSIFAAYGCGQLCSMMIRSSVLASFAAVALSVFIAAWSYAAHQAQLPAQWFVAGVGSSALVATLAGCRRWLADAAGARRWTLPGLVLAVGVALVVLPIPRVRNAQVGGSNFSVPPALSKILSEWDDEQAAAEAVAAQYARVNAALSRKYEERGEPRHGAHGDAFLRDCEPEFNELEHLSMEPRCRMSSRSWVGASTSWLIDDSERHLKAGNLETSLTRLMTARRMAAHATQYQSSISLATGTAVVDWPRIESLLLQWCVAPGQTARLLGDAARQLGDCERLEPGAEVAVVADHIEIRPLLMASTLPEVGTANQTLDQPASALVPWAWRLHRLPGENVRALTALDRLTDARLAYVSAVGQATEATAVPGQPTDSVNALKQLLHPSIDSSAGASRTPRLPGDPMPSDSVSSGPINATQHRSIIAASETSLLPALELARRGSLVDAMTKTLNRRARRRAEVIRVALVAYREQHGEYPDVLTDLLLSEDQDRQALAADVIVDPYSRRPYEYRPRGMDLPIARTGDATLDDLIPAGTPMLWSIGSTFVRTAEAWVAERHAESGESALVAAHDPALAPLPTGEQPVRVIRFYAETDFANRGPILLLLPD